MSSSNERILAGTVVAVCADLHHRFSKPARDAIRLIEGLGVEADAHYGAKVRHIYNQRHNPDSANLRQVHLVQSELFAEVAREGFRVKAGELGENITTAGVDLMALPAGALIELGTEARIEITGLRGPCKQIEQLQPGRPEFRSAVTVRTASGSIALSSAVMAVVRNSGVVRPGDPMCVILPPEPHQALKPV